MKRMIIAMAVLLAGCAPAGHLAVVQSITADDGKYDYITVDPVLRRAFIGRETGVMTLDLNTDKIGWLIKRDNVAAPLLITGTSLMLTTNGGSDSVTLLDRTTGAVTADIAVGKGPDGAWYDAATHKAYVMNSDDHSISVIDITSSRVVATWPVDGAPEGATGDGKGHLFVNLEDHNAIAVIDMTSGKTTGNWPLPGCDEPTGLVHDDVAGVLIPACHNHVAKVIDATTGADRGTIKIGGGADGSLFDPAVREGYIPCIDGTLTAYHLDNQGRVSHVRSLVTADGARTAAFDPANGRLYLPAADVERDKDGGYVTARQHFHIVVVTTR